MKKAIRYYNRLRHKLYQVHKRDFKLRKLKKQLGLLDVFCVAAGAMISSGLFVLPGIAYAKAGPAVILAYLFASILILPSLFSKAELSTAMPKAGGTYFYVERSLGPIWGLFTGLANWFSLALKSAFAIVGMAVFIKLLTTHLFAGQLSEYWLKIIAIVCCIIFTVLNSLSVKHTSRLQITLVIMLLVVLAVFTFAGSKSVEAIRYKGFLDKGWAAVFATAGLVFVSFGGLTKAASIAEEVRNPAKNLPLGMLLAWFVVSAFYLGATVIVVGVVDGAQLSNSYIPISLAAGKFMGPVGFGLLAIGAVAAFITTANGGILAASRSPMAMSRDKLLPPILAQINKKFKTPHFSIIITGVFMTSAIAFLDIEVLVKTASTLMIILFILANASVIIMRESKIQSYRPKFKAPLYPYLQIIVIIVYIGLIIDMGAIPLTITAIFIAISALWYLVYIQRRVIRQSALMHVVERVTDKQLRTVTLENELRDILMERDNIIADRFDRLISKCEIVDIEGRKTADEVFQDIAEILATRLQIDQEILFEKFRQREAESQTVIQPGLAIPHIVIDGEHKFDIVLVRAIDGIEFPKAEKPVNTMFVLVGSKDERNYHLRALMAIAQISQEKDFKQQWLNARDCQAIRNLILLSTRKRDEN